MDFPFGWISRSDGFPVRMNFPFGWISRQMDFPFRWISRQMDFSSDEAYKNMNPRSYAYDGGTLKTQKLN
jgi:hypothetical protein